jgi:hypothetical protein
VPARSTATIANGILESSALSRFSRKAHRYYAPSE